MLDNSVLCVLIGPCSAFSWVGWVQVEGSHPSDTSPSDQVTSRTSAWWVPLCFAEERVWAVPAPWCREVYPISSHRLRVGLGGRGQSGGTLCHPPAFMELHRARMCQQNESRCVRWEGDRVRCCCALGVRVRFVFSPYFNLNKTLNKK